MKKSKILFETTSSSEKYRVRKLVNRVSPKIDALLTSEQIEELQKDKNLTIEIVPSKV